MDDLRGPPFKELHISISFLIFLVTAKCWRVSIGKTMENQEKHVKHIYAKNNGNQIAGLTVGWKEGFTELT